MQRNSTMLESKTEARLEKKVKPRTKFINQSYPFYFLLGGLILYLVFSVIPGITGLLYSFTDWNSFSPDVHWVGFDNFATIFSSNENYLGFIQNTLIFTVLTIILKTVLGL